MRLFSAGVDNSKDSQKIYKKYMPITLLICYVVNRVITDGSNRSEAMVVVVSKKVCCEVTHAARTSRSRASVTINRANFFRDFWVTNSHSSLRFAKFPIHFTSYFQSVF